MAVNLGINIQRSPNRINQQLREAGVIGKYPKLLLDFADNYYLANGGSKTLANAVTHARAGNATMTDGYGPELVANGGFDSDSDWTLGTGWSIQNNRAYHASGANSNITQSIAVEAGKAYILEFDILEGSADFLWFAVDGVFTAVDNPQVRGGRSFVFTHDTTETIAIGVRAGSSNVATIDNISVREMPVIKWGPHNLVINSEDFSSGYTHPNVSLTSGVTDPTGGTSAFTATSSSSTGYLRPSNTLTVKAGVNYTLRVFHKNLSGTASIGAYDASNTAFIGTQSITNTSSDWAITEFTFTTPAGCTAIYVYAANSMSNGASVDAFGLHLYRSDLGGMVDNPERGDSYVPTTSSAVYLPRVGHHVYNGNAFVNEGVLAESESRTNLVTQSNEFDGSDWNDSRLTLTADSAVSPDGTENAYKLAQASGQTSAGFVNQPKNTTSGNSYVASVYAKAGTNREHIAFVETLLDGNAGYSYMNLTTGLAGTVASGHTVTTQDVGNGWYRFSVQFDCTSSQSSGVYSFRPIETDGTLTVTDDQGFIYIYGAQLEVGSTPSSLIPTSGSTVSRAAETFTIPSANLPWPTPQIIGSELVTSGTFDDSNALDDWTTSGSVSVVSGEAVIADVGGTDAYISQQLSGVVTGEIVILTFDQSAGTNLIVQVGFSAGSNLDNQFSGYGVGSHEIIIVAKRDNPWLSFRSFFTDTSNTIDNVSVREINPLSVSIGMEGRVTYANTWTSGTQQAARIISWTEDNDNRITLSIDQNDSAGERLTATQEESNVIDYALLTDFIYEGVLQSLNVAVRCGSTFVQVASNGQTGTANLSPTALPDLSSTDLELAYNYMGTISEFRIWDRDITDAGLVEATNPSLEPSLSLTFEGTGTNSFVVNNWSE